MTHHTVEALTERMDSLARQGARHNERQGEINETCQRIIRAVHDTSGKAWLGFITLPDDQPAGAILQPWDGKSRTSQDVCTFVVPVEDEQLASMIADIRAAPFTTPRQHIERIAPIMDRIADIGGVYLCWA